jgi:hypothetical protein
MKKLLTIAALAEGATGLACLIVPSSVGQLLFGGELTGIAGTVTRLAGIALIALGVACSPAAQLAGMLTYSTLATLYLVYLGVRAEWVGPLLWPAVVLHVVLTFALAVLLRNAKKD